MKLTILGAGSAAPRAGGACSGYLVQEGNTSALLDCGTGVLSNLAKVVDLPAVTAVVLSHCHADHWLDLIPYRYAIKYSIRTLPTRPSFSLPPGGTAILEGIAAAFEPAGGFFGQVFPLSEYDPDRGFAIGPLRFTFVRTQHVVPTWAIRVQCGSRSLAYSADTGPSRAIESFVRGADLFLCEATLQGPGSEAPTALHLSAIQAAQLAARAGVGKLLLTHIWPELDPAVSLAEALPFFPATALAVEMASYEV